MINKDTVKLLFPCELNSTAVSNVPSRTLAPAPGWRISVGGVCAHSHTTVRPQPGPQRRPEEVPTARAAGYLGGTTKDLSQKTLSWPVSVSYSVSPSVMTGPLSRLPPNPFFSQRGGAQPASQWQLWLLLHSWGNTMEINWGFFLLINPHRPVPVKKKQQQPNTVEAHYAVLAFWIKKYLHLRLVFLLPHQLKPCLWLHRSLFSETHPVPVALIVALVSSEERCIATFPVKTNLLKGDQVSEKSSSHKGGENYIRNLKK